MKFNAGSRSIQWMVLALVVGLLAVSLTVFLILPAQSRKVLPKGTEQSRLPVDEIAGVTDGDVPVYPKDEKAVFALARSTSPAFRDFLVEFPEAHVFMGVPGSIRFTEETKREALETAYICAEIGLYGRYIFTVTQPCRLKPDGSGVQKLLDASFELREIEWLVLTPGGNCSVGYGSNGTGFDYEKFKFLRQHGLDFSSIGFKARKNDPLEHFELAWKP
jgi:hypothetical protein